MPMLRTFYICGVWLFAILFSQTTFAGLLAVVGLGDHREPIDTWQIRELVVDGEKEARATLKGRERAEKMLEVQEAAIQTLIDQTLILFEFKAEGRTLPEELVDQRIAQITRDECGGDPNVLMQKISAVLGSDPMEKFREIQRKKLIIAEMRRLVSDRAAQAGLNPQQAEKEWMEQLRRKAYIKVYYPTDEDRAAVAAGRAVEPPID